MPSTKYVLPKACAVPSVGPLSKLCHLLTVHIDFKSTIGLNYWLGQSPHDLFLEIPQAYSEMCFTSQQVSTGSTDICEMSMSLPSNIGQLIEFPTCKWKKRLFESSHKFRVGFGHGQEEDWQIVNLPLEK